MKFNYIKGTEKDFEGVPEKYIIILDKGKYRILVDSVDMAEAYSCPIIAHREPITETLSWYEKSELPPVGEIVEVKMSGEWFPTEIIGFTKSGSIVFSLPFDVFNRLYDSFDSDVIKNSKLTGLFRPLKSKQEKEVDELVTALSGAWRESSGIADLSKIAKKLYDLGYRKIEK